MSSPNSKGIFLDPSRVDSSVALNVDDLPNTTEGQPPISILEIFSYYPSPPASIQTKLGTIENPWALQAGSDYDFLATTLYGIVREYENYPEMLTQENGPYQKAANSWGAPGGFTLHGHTFVPNGVWIP